mmetsp:Transcript_20453/g.57039  ORF Transcript_20453/g.57039 Transcript_20453/m.57039 type:complete len:217 (-) Transcript_20453:31-681(-)
MHMRTTKADSEKYMEAAGATSSAVGWPVPLSVASSWEIKDSELVTTPPMAIPDTTPLIWTGEKRDASCRVPPCRSAVQRPIRPMEGSVNLAMMSPDSWVFNASAAVEASMMSVMTRGCSTSTRSESRRWYLMSRARVARLSALKLSAKSDMKLSAMNSLNGRTWKRTSQYSFSVRNTFHGSKVAIPNSTKITYTTWYASLISSFIAPFAHARPRPD